MRRISITILSIILSILLVSCSKIVQTSKPIDINSDQYEVESDGHVEKIVNELCSSDYMGRVVGTRANFNASQYIKIFFEDLSLPPFQDNNYYSNLTLRINEEVRGAKSNISSIIKGTDSSKAVFITAHLDHIKGKNGFSLQGAIDNASGVSVMLEIAHKLSDISKNTPFIMDIVFVAFNAEETGLNGSFEFMEKNKSIYNEIYNINIDCVGYKNASNLVMGNNHIMSESLYDSMRKLFKDEGVQFNDELYATKNGMQMGTSDHEIFRQLGFPAIIIGDENILDVVHTTNDNLDNIDFSDLEKISDAISKFIVKYNGEMFQ